MWPGCFYFPSWFALSLPHFCLISPSLQRSGNTKKRRPGTLRTQVYSSSLWSTVWGGRLDRIRNLANLSEFTSANQEERTGCGAPALYLITTKWSTNLGHRAGSWTAGRTEYVDFVWNSKGEGHLMTWCVLALEVSRTGSVLDTWVVKRAVEHYIFGCVKQ